jgi:hypothetical protein
LQSISTSTFASSDKLTTVNIPKGITEIGAHAFSSCTSLTEVDLSGCTQLTTIGAHAFTTCTALTKVDLTGCSNIEVISNSAFSNDSALTSIDLDECVKLKEIGSYAFANCTALSNIGDLSKCTQLQIIDMSAFYYSSSLKGDLVLPASVIKIGERAFRGVKYTTIKLTNTSGWYYTTNSDYTGGTLFEDGVLDDVATCTDYLKNSYYTYYWHK